MKTVIQIKQISSDEAKAQALAIRMGMIADPLAAAIVKEFPERFANR